MIISLVIGISIFLIDLSYAEVFQFIYSRIYEFKAQELR
jgi:hypothetical protein